MAFARPLRPLGATFPRLGGHLSHRYRFRCMSDRRIPQSAVQAVRFVATDDAKTMADSPVQQWNPQAYSFEIDLADGQKVTIPVFCASLGAGGSGSRGPPDAPRAQQSIRSPRCNP